MSFSQVLLFTLGCGAIVAAVFGILLRLFAATASRGHGSLPHSPRARLAPAACVHCGHDGPLARPLGVGLARACARCGR